MLYHIYDKPRVGRYCIARSSEDREVMLRQDAVYHESWGRWYEEIADSFQTDREAFLRMTVDQHPVELYNYKHPEKCYKESVIEITYSADRANISELKLKLSTYETEHDHHCRFKLNDLSLEALTKIEAGIAAWHNDAEPVAMQLLSWPHEAWDYPREFDEDDWLNLFSEENDQQEDA